MKLVLSRVEPRDLDQLARICLSTFREAGFDVAKIFFGPEAPTSYAYAKKVLLHGMTDDPADILLKIEDLDAEVNVDVLDDEGQTIATERRTRIVSMSNWKLYPTYVAPTGTTETTKPKIQPTANEELARRKKDYFYLNTDQERAEAEELITEIMTRRARDCPEAHLLCFILFTDPEYQRKGCGRMMLQWGNDVADAMMLPCWLEATPGGEPVYKKMGYEVKDRFKSTTTSLHHMYAHMRRPAMVGKLRLEGKSLIREVPGEISNGH